MSNHALKELLADLFDAQYLDSIHCQSSDSILASVNIAKQHQVNMQKITKIGGKEYWRYIVKEWMKKPKMPRTYKNQQIRSSGGFSRVELDPSLSFLNSIYRQLPSVWQNLLKEHIRHERTYSDLAETSKEYFNKQLTPIQIREIFRRQIYPVFYEQIDQKFAKSAHRV